eukprot:5783724-Pyramimonas_sp.AAC.1
MGADCHLSTASAKAAANVFKRLAREAGHWAAEQEVLMANRGLMDAGSLPELALEVKGLDRQQPGPI